MTLEDFLVEMSRYSGERREFLLILSGDMLPELMSMQSRFIHTQHRPGSRPCHLAIRTLYCMSASVHTYTTQAGSRPCHLAIRTLYCMSASGSRPCHLAIRTLYCMSASVHTYTTQAWKQTLSPGSRPCHLAIRTLYCMSASV